MKFISKSTNLCVILKPGIPAQPITGTPATPTISVRFQGGIAEVNQEELITMMLRHPAFNRDFVSAEDATPDPYAYLRQPAEPTHVLTDMVYGHPGKRTASPVKQALSPEVRKIIQAEVSTMAKDMAMDIAKQMLPGMVAEALKNIVQVNEADKAKKSPGRPKKIVPIEEGAGAVIEE